MSDTSSPVTTSASDDAEETAPDAASEVVDAWDPGTPPELVPTAGTHPNQRAYYQRLVLDRFLDPPAPPPSPPSETGFEIFLPSESSMALERRRPAPISSTQPALEASGQIDVTSSLLDSVGFDRVAVGAVVEFSQSWYTFGLALGQLLHSLALAPGESTRIAMVDWERRERGERTERVSEADRLASQQLHTRALNEVVDAVAREFQFGSSASQASGESWGFGKSGGGGGTYGGEGQGYGFGGGYSLGYGTGKSQASSWGVSTGTRNLRSELTQNITDLTQQASTMNRERWSTVVQEVSQEEHEQLSTRAVTNYNHMHALTVQYYEVIQLYRVVVDLNRVTRALFVPMKVLDFRRRELVRRFRGVIEAAALTPEVGRAFRADADTVVLSVGPEVKAWDMRRMVTEYGANAWTLGSPELAIPLAAWNGFHTGSNDKGQPFRWLVIERLDGTEFVQPFILNSRDAPPNNQQGLWDLTGIAGAPFPRDEPFAEIRRISLRRGEDFAEFEGTVNLSFMGHVLRTPTDDDPAGIRLPGGTITLEVEPGTADITLLDVTVGADYGVLVDHLRDNALHYSQAIWSSLDPATLTLALAPFTVGGRPIMEAIDPTPVAVAGNYLVFRTYTSDASWDRFIVDKKLQPGEVSETLVPLPSGGVFAEAVLGRANSAEKLDASRFWNWQDSPIPIVASEIAALSAGSRNQTPALGADPLSPTVLNIMNPTPLPDPTGMSAALNAIAQGSMFRDMSGLAGTIGLAGTALQEAFGGSEAAQRWAAENFKTAASLVNKSGQKAATTSEQGAKANQGKDMDQRSKQDPSGVGPNEQAAFERSLSPPPLVEAQPEGSDPSEWAPWPGDDREFEPKHGGGGTVPSPTPKKNQQKIVPITLELRWFIPSEAYLTTEPIAIRGDNRSYDPEGGSSRASITYSARVNADLLTVTETSGPQIEYGDTELYWSSDTTRPSEFPVWWRQIKPGATPIGGTLARLDDPKAMSASWRKANNRIEITLQLHGTPQFPWRSAEFLPDIEVGPFDLQRIVGSAIATTVADADAVVKVTITKRADGMLEYTTSGWHDNFGAWEVYVNGEPGYLVGGDEKGIGAGQPNWLGALTNKQITITAEPHLLRPPSR
jgi:hypothetical protein